VIFDSAQINYTEKNTEAGAHLKYSIDKQVLGSGKEQTLDLAPTGTFTGLMKGSVRVYYHTTEWNDLTAVDFPFCLTMGNDAPEETKYIASLSNYPNPSFGKTTVSFTMPSQAFATIKIYDALGRLIRTVSQGVTGEGLHSVEVSGLAGGSYTIELLAPEIGVSEHREMIVL
jgi:hypothetical protein